MRTENFVYTIKQHIIYYLKKWYLIFIIKEESIIIIKVITWLNEVVMVISGSED